MSKDQPISQEQVEEIERFLQHTMSQEERTAFTTRMNADPQLKEATDEMRLLFTGVQEAVLQQRLDKFHAVIPAVSGTQKTTGGTVRVLRRWLVAASILIIAAFSTWIFFFRSPNKQDLFASYYQPDPGLISAMSTSDNYAFDKAMIDYKVGNYDAAIHVWDSLNTLQPQNDTLNYFLGSALLAKGDYRQSVPYFQKVTVLSQSSFVSDANWFIALAFVKSNNLQGALNSLEKTQHPQKESLIRDLLKQSQGK